MTRLRMQRRLRELEQRVQPKPGETLRAWMATLTNDDVDVLATAAKASKDKGMNTVDMSLIDPETAERLSADYLRFEAEYEQHLAR